MDIGLPVCPPPPPLCEAVGCAGIAQQEREKVKAFMVPFPGEGRQTQCAIKALSSSWSTGAGVGRAAGVLSGAVLSDDAVSLASAFFAS